MVRAGFLSGYPISRKNPDPEGKKSRIPGISHKSRGLISRDKKIQNPGEKSGIRSRIPKKSHSKANSGYAYLFGKIKLLYLAFKSACHPTSRSPEVSPGSATLNDWLPFPPDLQDLTRRLPDISNLAQELDC